MLPANLKFCSLNCSQNRVFLHYSVSHSSFKGCKSAKYLYKARLGLCYNYSKMKYKNIKNTTKCVSYFSYLAKKKISWKWSELQNFVYWPRWKFPCKFYVICHVWRFNCAIIYRAIILCIIQNSITVLSQSDNL